jgi:hypothetical protein
VFLFENLRLELTELHASRAEMLEILNIVPDNIGLVCKYEVFSLYTPNKNILYPIQTESEQQNEIMKSIIHLDQRKYKANLVFDGGSVNLKDTKLFKRFLHNKNVY